MSTLTAEKKKNAQPEVSGQPRRKRYAIHGLSVRGIHHFVLPLTGKADAEHSNDFSDCAELVAVVDVDPGRVEAFNRKNGLALPCYAPADFERMVAEQKPDIILIAGPDHTHAEAILKALDCGCDVIAEKPMVRTIEEAQAVIRKERETGRKVRVSFNNRFKNSHKEIKRLLQDGAIGRIINVEFTYNLDTIHGASYFWRWNRQRALSGGLNIHKMCHHLDMINWWLDDWPETVFAFGGLNYYGPNGAHRPLDADGNPLPLDETKRRCPYFQKHLKEHNDPAAARIKMDGNLQQVPYDVQYPPNQPAYLYDSEIDVEDTYSSVLRFRRGALLTYSVNFSTPWEGYNLAFNGTHGRLETSYRSPRSADILGFNAEANTTRIHLLPLFDKPQVIDVENGSGGHGGADEPLQRNLFRAETEEAHQLSLLANSLAGAYAVAAGEAIAQAVASGQPQTIPHFESI